MNIREAIEKLVNRADLSEAETVDVMNQIMTGEATPLQVASFLTALRMKGETVEEITGAGADEGELEGPSMPWPKVWVLAVAKAIQKKCRNDLATGNAYLRWLECKPVAFDHYDMLSCDLLLMFLSPVPLF